MTRTLTPDELATTLPLHGKWFRGEPGGKRADLSGANLSWANLSGANLGCGWTWEDYAGPFTALLCESGGVPLAEVAAAWTCHEWANCPMHVALGIESPDQAPKDLRDAVSAWVPLFDAGQIPQPVVAK